MPEATTELKYVSTADLTDELCNRHSEIMIIREDLKDENMLKILTKTGPGKSGNFETDDYDFAKAMDLIETAMTMLTGDYILTMNPPEEGSDDPQEAQEGP